MSDNTSPRQVDRRPFEWAGPVATSIVGGGFAYVPNRVIVRPGLDPALLQGIAQEGEELSVTAGPSETLQLVVGRFDVVRLVAQLRAAGFAAQPDHVFFAHSCECCCGDHPFDVFGNPVKGNPVKGNPVKGNGLDAELPITSSARPSKEPVWFKLYHGAGAKSPRITVIDSGLADPADQLPDWLKQASIGSPDIPDLPDDNNDRWLDPIAGHGTFIAGIIEQHAPGCAIKILDRLQPQGQGVESDLIAAIRDEAALPDGDRPQILSLSFGGSIWEKAFAIEEAILNAQQRGIVVVASAGNDSTCEPSYPAAIPGVVSVGAIGPDGPAWFTNYGSWVRACAPGVDIVSSFFNKFNGAGAPGAGRDPDEFSGWAKWSGTSFSAPTVVAALVREMRWSGTTAQQAVERVIDAPWLMRVAGLGTVVNL